MFKKKWILAFIIVFAGFFALPELTAFASELSAAGGGHGSGGSELPAWWSVIPFGILLLMIATGPLFYAHFWHKNYPLIAVALGVLVIGYYIFSLHNVHQPVHSMAEYISFISLLTALFVASGGILIKVDKKGTPMVNIALLIFGAIIANVIGTTGASMLLIRPFVRLNKDRIKPYHIVFFIFMVSNVGGCLTPIGDPPLFLGFLKGINFWWTLTNIWGHWLFGIILLSMIFYVVDSRNKLGKEDNDYSGKIEVKGLKNLIWLAVTIGAVFLDPNILKGIIPFFTDSGHISIDASYKGFRISFVRELIMFIVAFLSFRLSDKECLKGNEFDFEPIKEVAFLFVGIFGTMMPALQLVGEFAKKSPQMVNKHFLYWSTGGLSGVLDNAPTYLNFLAASMGKYDKFDFKVMEQVDKFSNTPIVEKGGVIIGEPFIELQAISIAAVFFGAMTYIGNAPNFMVKSIAEQIGIQMPSFIGYVVKYAIPFLLPVLLLTWLVFFSGYLL